MWPWLFWYGFAKSGGTPEILQSYEKNILISHSWWCVNWQFVKCLGFDVPAAGEKKARPKYTKKRKTMKKKDEETVTEEVAAPSTPEDDITKIVVEEKHEEPMEVKGLIRFVLILFTGHCQATSLIF